jgi:hypothetical protein
MRDGTGTAGPTTPYRVTVQALPPEGGERVDLLGERARFATQEAFAARFPDLERAYREGRLGAPQRGEAVRPLVGDEEAVGPSGPAGLVYRLELTPEALAREFPQLDDQLERRRSLAPGWRVRLEVEVAPPAAPPGP